MSPNLNDIAGLGGISDAFQDTDELMILMLDVVGSLSWLSGTGGPIASAVIDIVKKLSFPGKTGQPMAETLIKQLNTDFQSRYVNEIVARIKTIIRYEEKIGRRTDDLKNGTITWEDYQDLVIRDSGYREELTRLLGASSDSLYQMLYSLFEDDDLNLNATYPYKDKAHWETAYRKLVTQQQAMTCLLKTYLHLIIIDVIAGKPQMGDLRNMEDDFTHFSSQLEDVSKHTIYERRKTMVKDIMRVDNISTHYRKLENANEKCWANDAHRSSIFESMTMSMSPKLWPFWETDIHIDLLVDSDLTGLWNDKWSKGAVMGGWSFEDAGTGKAFRVCDDVAYNNSLAGGPAEPTVNDRKPAIEAIRKDYIEKVLPANLDLLHEAFIKVNEKWKQIIKTAKSKILPTEKDEETNKAK